MSLLETINNDFLVAYKAKEMEKKDFLGVLKTEVTRETKMPSDDSIISIVKSMLKKGMDANMLTPTEIYILESYLPKQMDENDLTIIISKEIESSGYDSIKDMGKIMAFLKENYSGQYDGSLASLIVKKLLS